MDQLEAQLRPQAAGAADGFRALPDPSPLDMPTQSLRALPPGARERRAALRPSGPARVGWRRFLVFGLSVLLTVAAMREMYLVLAVHQLTPLAAGILVLFAALFAWIALSLVSAACGMFALLRAPRPTPADQPPPVPQARTALLLPTYNEAPARVAATLQVIHEELDRLGALPQFDLFILSDTTDPDTWIAEEAAFLALRDRLGPACRVFYRHRPRNTGRKAGNIADWVCRFGGGYEYMLVLDADSVMEADILLRMVGMMERQPDAGLIQTLPILVNGRTLLARMQQFAGRLYGPMIAHGIAWWHGAEGNYWGHNAVIRTCAFADAAGLPDLRGPKPFGGHVLSHDFVEAALLRRAGWAVHLVPTLIGSYEEGPPSLPDLAIRDRRWCQGNLQHLAVLPARGLHWISRVHMLMGIGSYVTAPLWLVFLVAGILLSLQSRFIVPQYFPTGPSLFPNWPVVDPVRSMWVFIGTMGVLLLPKLMAYAALLADGNARRAFGGAGRALAGIVVETVVAGLVAPIAMASQSAAVVGILAGRDSGWRAQRRDDGSLRAADVARAYGLHTAIGLALGVAAFLVSPTLMLWMLPVLLGLALAVPLVLLTAQRHAGEWLGRMGLLATPEELSPPPALLRTTRLRQQLEAENRPGSGLLRLLDDPALMAAHRAMLPPPRRPGQDPFDPALLLASAKLAEAGSIEDLLGKLEGRELAALLGDRQALQAATRLVGAAG